MFVLIKDIIGFTGTFTSGHENILIYCCSALVTISFVVLLDLLYRIFRHFWR